jgi:hypothetical protein
MHPILSAIGSVATLRFRSRSSLELEIIALRHQLGVLRRRHPKVIQVPVMDRLFWVWLYRLWPRILEIMVIAKPRTVIRWHYAGFRMFWRWRSRRSRPWRRVGPEVRDLIYQMKRDNPIWGVRRISGELKKIGFNVSATTVANYLPRYRSPPSPGWKAFLANHAKEIAAVDFLVVVTMSFHLLYAMVVISHGRRRILHVDVTSHPTQDWAAEQISRAFSSNRKPKYLIRDRDSIYGQRFRDRLHELQIKEKVTAKQSPLQNILVERTIQSIRHECLDHVIVLNERHLKRLLTAYSQYFNFSRTHTTLAQDCPVHRPIERASKGKRIVAIPQVGGLHHRYERRAA